ncbi:hypothetical protein Ocin01_20236 [Orchesella cincta]|uniref:Uncharacterized protein n=1 Tax=Orchesella cincta TaxID=48709 RepID=A0A1D2M0G1_ORCCI|nr:hypothetical protein Ocin01_20236 [Orchesella cincta]
MNSKEVYKYRSQEDMYLFPIKAPRQERTGPTTTSCGLIVLDILVQCGTWIQTCSSFCSRRRRRVTRKLRALIIPFVSSLSPPHRAFLDVPQIHPVRGSGGGIRV